MTDQRAFASAGPATPGYLDQHSVPSLPAEDEPHPCAQEDRPVQRRRLCFSDAAFYAGCGGMGLLPATLAGVLLHEFIGEPVLFLLAVVTLTWVLTTVALVKLAGPVLRCRAIVAAGGLVSVALCSIFLFA
jgi:hypothetical protein